MTDDCRDTVPNCALTLLLLDAARAVEARAEGALGEIGLSLAKLGALRHLVLATEPLTLSQLAERHCCGKSNITQLVDRSRRPAYRASDGDSRRSRRIRARQRDPGRARAVNRHAARFWATRRSGARTEGPQGGLTTAERLTVTAP